MSVTGGGGMVLRDDQCIVQIGFYEAHFTAYQPETRGNREFCQELPDAAETLFVLDYLHDSLKEVPVSFRIIHNVTELGRFAQLIDVQALGNLDAVTIFRRSGTIQSDASLQVEHTFEAPGEYIGVVTAGHPSKPTIYTAAFPFEVGARNDGLWYAAGFIALLAAAVYIWQRRLGARARSQ